MLDPLTFNCPNTNCLASAGEMCGALDLRTMKRTTLFVIEGKPAFHYERLAQAMIGEQQRYSQAQIQQAVEASGLI